MVNFNDYIEDTNNYVSKIKDSIYIEGNENSIQLKGKEDICEIIIGDNELEYQILQENEKSEYITSKKLDVASNVVLDDTISKKFTRSIINKGLQNINHLSSILYLNEYYRINCIIHNESTGKYYRTTVKDYPKLNCIYKNNTWFIDKNITKINNDYSNNNDLSDILTIDCEFIIYKTYLKPIQKYKIKELEEICNSDDFNIELKDEHGKKKLKLRLYNEINLKYIKDF